MDDPPLRSKRDEYLLAMAAGVALTSKCRFKHGALILKNGNILAVSPNIKRNDPRYVDYNFSSVHAEIAALKKAKWPKKATVVVCRINNSGKLRLSRPCASCQEVLNSLKCKVVWSESE